jgi:site-specific recombinase XerD
VRVSEVCGLELTDVDLDRELAYVTGRGFRPRMVPFGAKIAQALDGYLRVRACTRTPDSRGCPWARATR